MFLNYGVYGFSDLVLLFNTSYLCPVYSVLATVLWTGISFSKYTKHAVVKCANAFMITWMWWMKKQMLTIRQTWFFELHKHETFYVMPSKPDTERSEGTIVVTVCRRIQHNITILYYFILYSVYIHSVHSALHVTSLKLQYK